RRLALLVVLAVAAADLLPLGLVLKQAFTPERESFAWPPTWLPRTLTLENVRALREAVEIEGGLGLSVLVATLTVAATLVIALPAAWAAARRRHVDRGLDGALGLARRFPTIALAIPLAALSIRLGLYNRPVGTGLWLAHTMLALPVGFPVPPGGSRSVPAELDEPARLDRPTAPGPAGPVSPPPTCPSPAP